MHGVNHVTFSVKDVEQSFVFYTQVLGMRPVARWPKGAYLMTADTWIALIQDRKLRKSQLPEYTHVAFSVSREEFGALSQRIRLAGAEIWKKNHSEGASLYFLDPNGHKLEIHTGDVYTRLAALKAEAGEGVKIF